MSNWKYVDARHLAVFREIDGGYIESMPADHEIIREYTSQGGVIEPSSEEVAAQ